MGLNKTNRIYLYEDVVYDEKSGYSFTALICYAKGIQIHQLVHWTACDLSKQKKIYIICYNLELYIICNSNYEVKKLTKYDT